MCGVELQRRALACKLQALLPGNMGVVWGRQCSAVQQGEAGTNPGHGHTCTQQARTQLRLLGVWGVPPACIYAAASHPQMHAAVAHSLEGLCNGPTNALVPCTVCHATLPSQVLHQLALCADMMGDSAAAIRWLEVLTSLVPHDPGVLCKLGAIYHM